MNTLFLQETKRKLFHATSAFYAILFVVAGRQASVWILGIGLVLAAILEAVRLRVPSVNQRLVAMFGGIHREEELHRPSGIFWTLTGCFLTIWLLPFRDIVLASLWYLAAGDAVAGLVGRNWGHIRIGRKSLEGSLSCFLVCWLVGSLCLTSNFGSSEIIFGALVATVVEALPLPLNDNMWIPFLSGLALTLLRLAS